MSTESTYVVNVKTSAGTIVTVRGDTAQELANNINEFEENAVALSVSALEGLLVGTQTPVTPAAVASALGGTIVDTSFAPVPPPTQAGQMNCSHGTMVKRSGSGAKGEWRGYFCPTPKGTPDQCQPQFLKRGSSEWNNF